MKTSRKDNWIAKVSKGTIIHVVYGEGRKQLCKQVKQDSNSKGHVVSSLNIVIISFTELEHRATCTSSQECFQDYCQWK